MSTLREYEAIYTQLEALLSKRGKGIFKRVWKLGKNVYNAKAVKKEIVKQRQRVRDAQHKFLVRYTVHRSLSLY